MNFLRVSQMPAQVVGLVHSTQNLQQLAEARAIIQQVTQQAAAVPSFNTIEEFGRICHQLSPECKQSLYVRVSLAGFDTLSPLIDQAPPASSSWSLDQWDRFMSMKIMQLPPGERALFDRCFRLDDILDPWDITPRITDADALAIFRSPARRLAVRQEAAALVESTYAKIKDNAVERLVYQSVVNKFLR